MKVPGFDDVDDGRLYPRDGFLGSCMLLLIRLVIGVVIDARSARGSLRTFAWKPTLWLFFLQSSPATGGLHRQFRSIRSHLIQKFNGKRGSFSPYIESHALPRLLPPRLDQQREGCVGHLRFQPFTLLRARWSIYELAPSLPPKVSSGPCSLPSYFGWAPISEVAASSLCLFLPGALSHAALEELVLFIADLIKAKKSLADRLSQLMLWEDKGLKLIGRVFVIGSSLTASNMEGILEPKSSSVLRNKAICSREEYWFSQKDRGILRCAKPSYTPRP
uniref:Uncharacterized protein n=1 Tax=Cannabis sativa TaxID=3483 RepID=A0A803PAM6_CANSA